MPTVALEICIDAPDGLAVARTGGADRVELCSALTLGGLTPGPGLVALAARSGLPAHAMIRPRPGGFETGQADMDACLADISHMRGAGLVGVVIGAIVGGALDEGALAAMVRAAGPMEVTLHRVVDTLPDPVAAVEVAARLGIGRILTSGGAGRAGEGVGTIAAMVRAARGRVEIMAGGGVTPESAPALLSAGVDALHASASAPVIGSEALGLPPARRTDADAVRALRAVLSRRAAA